MTEKIRFQKYFEDLNYTLSIWFAFDIIFSEMGVTKVKLTIKNPLQPVKQMTGDFLVDTGAHYTVLPQNFVKELGIKPSYKQEFSLADGRIIKRPIGGALVTFEGKELPVPVVLGQKDDDALLGLTTLENFGLMIDPFKRRIYHSKLMLA